MDKREKKEIKPPRLLAETELFRIGEEIERQNAQFETFLRNIEKAKKITLKDLMFEFVV